MQESGIPLSSPHVFWLLQTQATGSVCVRFQVESDETEVNLAGGSIQIGDLQQAVSTEDGRACLNEVSVGNSLLTVTAPPGTALFSDVELQLAVFPGKQLEIFVRVVPGQEAPTSPPTIDEPPLENPSYLRFTRDEDTSTQQRLAEAIEQNAAFIALGLAGIIAIVAIQISIFFRRGAYRRGV